MDEPAEITREPDAAAQSSAQAPSGSPASSEESWQQANAEFLSVAVRWIRLLLAELAPSPAASAIAERKRRLLGRPAPTRRRAARADLAPLREIVDEAHAAANPPGLAILAERFGLSRFEENVLLLCAAMELDTGIGRLCTRAHGNAAGPYPTFALAMQLFDEPVWEALSPERPLRFWRLLEISQPGAEPLTTSALRADERIVSFIKGLNYLDDRLTPLLVPFDLPAQDPLELPASQRAAADRVLGYLGQTLGGPASPVVQLVGVDALSRQMVARNAALRAGLGLYRVPAELLPRDSAELVTLCRLWHRESILLPLALFLDADVGDRATGENAERESRAAIRRFLDRSGGAFFVGTREVLPQLGATSLAVDVRKPSAVEQRAAWESGEAALGGEEAARLAGQFDLNVATIRALSRLAADGDTPAGEAEVESLWAACLSATRPRLDLLAERLEPKAGWDDIVLPAEARELLGEIARQVASRSRVYDEWGFRRKMSRGLGISALFAGESGTGKTMAAEVLARELDLNLYRIDLSAVVSKYIGETEKNLRQLFDAAEDGGAILFFDEADALFGKRSEVKDSHDRYANIEINYLLQRMEAFEGLAILATNLRSALDKAFVRRLRFIVTFPFPGADERAEIWKRVFPEETPVEDLDYARLGQLSLTGGSIHNVALNASFAAAQNGGRVTMPLVLAAARADFRKMERPINEADFRWDGPREVA